jgi:zinc transport system permease protein
MIEGFLLMALAGGVGVALVAGPLGSLVIWRRMAYFGDSLAHSALLGVALGLIFEIGTHAGVLLLALCFAGLLVMLEHQRQLGMDALLGIVSHSALALGLVVLSLSARPQLDLMSFLVGDVLTLGGSDLLTLILGGGAILIGLSLLWRRLISVAVDDELAAAEGIQVWTVRLGFMILIALFVVISLKVVGVLLITSLLIIPAATARGMAKSPEQMALLASLVGALSVVFGLMGSLRYDVPAGPAIVLAAAVLFGASQIWQGVGKR